MNIKYTNKQNIAEIKEEKTILGSVEVKQLKWII